jgi:hypothetical protein
LQGFLKPCGERLLGREAKAGAQGIAETTSLIGFAASAHAGLATVIKANINTAMCMNNP